MLLLVFLLPDKSIAGTHPAEFLWHQPYTDSRQASNFYTSPDLACISYSLKEYPPGLPNVIAVIEHPFDANKANSASCRYTQWNGQVTEFTKVNYEAVCYTNNNIFMGLAFGLVCYDSCYAPTIFSNDTKMCVNPERYSLSLTGMGGEIEPSGTRVSGNSTRIGYVSVMNAQTSQPKVGAVVRLSINVDATSGGHDHGESYARRDRGTISGCDPTGIQDTYDCTTLDNGQAQFTFTAPEASGAHSFTATCINPVCNNTSSDNIVVKVDGLEQIPDSQYYSLTESNGDVIGAKPGWHTDNHNLTPVAIGVLVKIAVNYYFNPKFYVLNPVTNLVSNPPVLHLNDASLPWGGVYDICARPGACPDLDIIVWHKPHSEHRRGTVIDVRANGADGAIPASNKKQFIDLLVKYGVPYKHESIGTSNEHFHLRLMGKRE